MKKKTMENENDDDNNCNWGSWYSHKWIATGIGGLGKKGTSKDHPSYSIAEIGRNPERSLWVLRWLAVTQIPVENHRLTLVWKTQIIIIKLKFDCTTKIVYAQMRIRPGKWDTQIFLGVRQTNRLSNPNQKLILSLWYQEHLVKLKKTNRNTSTWILPEN